MELGFKRDFIPGSFGLTPANHPKDEKDKDKEEKQKTKENKENKETDN